MSSHSLWASCLSYFSPLEGWSEATDDLPPDAEDETPIRAFQARERDFVFLVPPPSDGSVRVVRGVWPDALGTSGVAAMTAALGALAEWVWLADEWAVNAPSVMLHPPTGALAFVLDVCLEDAPSDEKSCHQVLRGWMAAGDEWMVQVGLSVEAPASA